MMERKHRARLWLFGGMTFACMLMIFLFSAQHASESQRLSDGFLSSLIGAFLERFLPHLSEKGMSVDIRKYAHMAEYFCLGVSTFLFVSEMTRWQGRGKAVLLSSAWCLLYACTDELHQVFVPGRAGRVSDVLIDGVGFGSSILLLLLIRLIFEKKREQEKE